MTPPTTHPEMRWIPVGERLPEDGQIVIASIASGNSKFTEVFIYRAALELFDDSTHERPTFRWPVGLRNGVFGVTAWMPLPAPYQEPS